MEQRRKRTNRVKTEDTDTTGQGARKLEYIKIGSVFPPTSHDTNHCRSDKLGNPYVDHGTPIIT